jgi:hypothetical protein
VYKIFGLTLDSACEVKANKGLICFNFSLIEIISLEGKFSIELGMFEKLLSLFLFSELGL